MAPALYAGADRARGILFVQLRLILGSGGCRQISFASRAQPSELEVVPQDLEIGYPACDLVDCRKQSKGQICNPAAFCAPHMIVIVCHSIKTFLCPGCFQFIYQAGIGQDLKVTVDRSQADPGHPLTHLFINFVRSWMGVNLPEFLNYDAALPGHAELAGNSRP
jgi:hypothetical protein